VKSKTPLSEPFSSPVIYAVIPAGGVGSRVGADRPKQYLPVLGRKTMLELSASILLEQDWISKVLVVVAAQDGYQAALCRILKRRYGPRIEFLLEGGDTRRDTVLSGLRYLLTYEDQAKIRRRTKAGETLSDTSGGVLKPEKGLKHGLAQPAWVLVHDAARPGLDALSLEKLKARVLADTKKSGGLLAVPMSDTVKQVRGSGRALEARSSHTLDRSLLWAAQTPQMFPLEKLADALTRFRKVTDEASAIEQAGGKPHLVRGRAQNFKVTTEEDLLLMRALLKAGR
jgi:2-C-methyl-D-erythritol 4-phosphate cytidylyltransferase